MLALPRIAAVPDGTSPPVGNRRPGKAVSAIDSPFAAMLAGLASGKATPAGNPKAMPKPAIEQSVAKAKAEATGASVNGAPNKGAAALTAADKATRAADAASPGQASRQLEVLNASPEKPSASKGKDGRNGRQADDDGRLGAMLAQPAMLAEAKASPNRLQAGSAGKRSDGSRESSGIEVVGTSDGGKDGARVSIIDLRLKAARDGSARRDGARSGASRSGGSVSGGDAEAPKAEQATAGVRVEADPSMSAGRLAAAPDGSSGTAAAGEGAQAAPKTFTETLASRLRDGAADIVRSAQVVLRDGGLGVIRLRLEPESLGGVKIELKLAEKQISGKITVESDIAGEAFKSSLDALKDAFAECGFETTSLEVEVRNGMASGPGSGGTREGKPEDGPYWSRSLRELDAAVPPLATGGRDGILNVIV